MCRIRRVPFERLVVSGRIGLTTVMHRAHAWVPAATNAWSGARSKWARTHCAWRDSPLRLGSDIHDVRDDERRAVRGVARGKLLPASIAARPRLDNLAALTTRGLPASRADHGTKVMYQPTYSPDLNPIESARGFAEAVHSRPASARPLLVCRLAQRARRRVIRHHCERWFRYAGYANQRF